MAGMQAEQGVTTYSHVADLGQPGWAQELGDGQLAVRAWSSASVHPLSGSWLNMAESVQRIVVRRALCGEHLQSTEAVIRWLEETVEGWNRHTTPFVWGGKRQARRVRARLRRLGGSGAAVVHGYSIAA